MPLVMHVYSIENKKLAYKLSTSTRVAFDVMITIAMSNALEFFFFVGNRVLTLSRLKLYLSIALGHSKELSLPAVIMSELTRRLKESKNGSCYHYSDPIHCQHEFYHDVCHLGSFFLSLLVNWCIFYLPKMFFDQWARNGESFIPILVI